MKIVCLHGFTGARASWQAVIECLPKGIETICLPIVGHEAPVPQGRQSFEDEVDRLADSLPVKGPLHVAGYSLGGRLALGLLVRHGRLFSGATLIGAHPGLSDERQRRERIRADDALASKLEHDGLERFVDTWQNLPLFESQRSLPRSVLETQRSQRLMHRPEGLAYALRTLSLGRMPDYGSKLRGINLPVRLMVGAHDLKFRRLAQTMAAALPVAIVDIVPAAGHNLILETPRTVASAIAAVA